MTDKIDEKLLPKEEKLIENPITFFEDAINSQRKTVNRFRQETKELLTKAFKDGVICWGLSEEELFHILYYYIGSIVESEKIAKAILERLRDEKNK